MAQIYIERHQGQAIVEREIVKTMDEARGKILAWIGTGVPPAEIICYVVQYIKFSVVQKTDIEFEKTS